MSQDERRFLVSAYAFSEFSEPVRQLYEESVVPYCDHGYLVWNMIAPYQFTSHSLMLEDEQPYAVPGNKMVKF